MTELNHDQRLEFLKKNRHKLTDNEKKLLDMILDTREKYGS